MARPKRRTPKGGKPACKGIPNPAALPAENKMVAAVAIRESERALLAKLEGFLTKRISDALTLALADVAEVL